MTGEIPADLMFLIRLMADNGYRDARPIGGGRYACIVPKLYTHAIITGKIFDEWGFEQNWCYRDYRSAKAALDAWDGIGEPGGWHRHVPSGRRVSQSPDEIDEDGNEVGGVGVMYVRS